MAVPVLCTLTLAPGDAFAQLYPGPGTNTPPLPSVGPRRGGDDTGSEQGAQRHGLRFEPSIGIEETWTSNANFDRGNLGQGRSDFVTEITPGFRVQANGAHSRLTGSVFVPILLYARTGSENNRILPAVHLDGTVDALDRHFFLDAGVDVDRQFLSPFGAQPVSAVTNSANEYTSQSYRLTPALRGELGGGYVRYELSDLNLWTRATNAPSALNNAYTNEAKAILTRDPTPLGWALNYDRANTRFTNDLPQKTEIARLLGTYAPDPQVVLTAIVGYENNDFAHTRYNNAVYGGGVKWAPGERTTLEATAEHRFFGTGYHVTFDHRSALTVWGLRASRDITSYPQQLAALGAGTQVSSILNQLFTSRFPDPLQRQQAVDALVRAFALPDVLTGPVNLYTQNTQLVTELRAIAGFLGARNNVYVSVFRQRNQGITPLAAQIEELLSVTDSTQTGATLTWSSRLAPTLTLLAQLNASHTTGNLTSFEAATRTNNGSAEVTLATPLSALTDFHVGARYQVFRSTTQSDAEEAAVFVGILHRFN